MSAHINDIFLARVLRIVQRSPNGIRPAGLAEILDVHVGTVSKYIRELNDMECIRKRYVSNGTPYGAHVYIYPSDHTCYYCAKGE